MKSQGNPRSSGIAELPHTRTALAKAKPLRSSATRTDRAPRPHHTYERDLRKRVMPSTFVLPDGTAVTETGAHGLGLMQLTATGLTSQLKSVVPGISWTCAGSKDCIAYCDMVKATFNFATCLASTDADPWITHAANSSALCREFEAAFAQVDKRATSWAALLVNLEEEYQKLDKVSRGTGIGHGDMIVLPASSQPDTAPKAWHMLITWGRLQRLASGPKSIGWLEQAAHRRASVLPVTRDSPGCAALDMLDEEARRRGLSDDNTGDIYRAFNALPSSIPSYWMRPRKPTRCQGDDRKAAAWAELQDGVHARDGTSYFAQGRVHTVVAAVAPTISLALRHIQVMQTVLSVVQQLGSVP